METKTLQAKNLYNSGNYKKSLALIKTFRLGITKKQKSKIIRAYECMIHPDFYKSLYKNLDEIISLGIIEAGRFLNES